MRILWLKTELLHPLDKGGRIRSYQMLKQLKREHRITYLTLCESQDSADSFQRASEYCHRLVPVAHSTTTKFSVAFYRDLSRNLLSPLPYAIQKYHSDVMQCAIERELQQTDYDLLVCDFLAPGVNLPEQYDIPTILFQHNVEAIIWKRHYQTTTNRVKKAYFYNQWRKMQKFETALCRKVDAVIAVSAVDRDLLRNDYGIEHVYDVPTGVDTDYFQPLYGAENPTELVFTGSMDWLPNEDAIFYFAEEILPRIASKIPDITLTVAGRNPSKRLVEFAEMNPHLTITGRVDDVRPYMDRATAYVVPIRIGGGTRLKIFEAMAMAKPVISTTIGAEGLAVQDGRELLIADEPQAFADAVIATLADKAFAQQIGETAREVVCAQFSWQQVANAFAQICERTQRRPIAVQAA
jgi:sugar transferase (PEP-CTERM/EpsH1 system associated)